MMPSCGAALGLYCVTSLIKLAGVTTFALLLVGCAINYDYNTDHDPRSYIKIETAPLPPTHTLEAKNNKPKPDQDDDVLAYSPPTSSSSR
jgi:hypothetical protein